MKNQIQFKPLNLLYNILVLALLFALVGVHVFYAVPAGVITGLIVGFAKSPGGSLYMAIQKDIWTRHVEQQLFKDNKFLSSFTPAEKENINGRTVTIPNAGAAANVVKNRTTLPATVTQRTDVPTSYEIAEFTTDPRVIKNADKYELSYDKRQSVIRDDTAKLAEEVAEEALLSIVRSPVGTTTNLPATSILVTAGGDVPATAPGATGNVKSYSINDFQRARSFLIRQKAWTEGQMYAVITAEAEAQMFPADSVVTATYMNAVSEAERRSGVMYKAFGFKIFTRSTAFILNAAGAFKPLSAAPATTDVEGIVFYNGLNVEFAMGDVEFFDNPGRSEYYGDLLSFIVRAGGRARRENFEGVLVIKQAPAA